MKNQRKQKNKSFYYLFDTKIQDYVEKRFESSYEVKHRKNMLETNPVNKNRYIIQKLTSINDIWKFYTI